MSLSSVFIYRLVSVLLRFMLKFFTISNINSNTTEFAVEKDKKLAFVKLLIRTADNGKLGRQFTRHEPTRTNHEINVATMQSRIKFLA